MREIVMCIMCAAISFALLLQIMDNLVVTFPELEKLIREICKRIRRHI